jgi:hypothetical protein
MVERVRLVSNSGHFANGNSAARGNRGPAAKRQIRRGRAALHLLLNQTDEKTGEVNWWRVWTKLLSRTLSGDVGSAKLVLGYALGEPRQAVDVNRTEYIDEVPTPHMGMSLAECTALYQRMLHAKRRPLEPCDTIDVEPQPMPSLQECTKMYEASLIAAGRKIND